MACPPFQKEVGRNFEILKGGHLKKRERKTNFFQTLRREPKPLHTEKLSMKFGERIKQLTKKPRCSIGNRFLKYNASRIRNSMSIKVTQQLPYNKIKNEFYYFKFRSYTYTLITKSFGHLNFGHKNFEHINFG